MESSNRLIHSHHTCLKRWPEGGPKALLGQGGAGCRQRQFHQKRYKTYKKKPGITPGNLLNNNLLKGYFLTAALLTDLSSDFTEGGVMTGAVEGVAGRSCGGVVGFGI